MLSTNLYALKTSGGTECLAVSLNATAAMHPELWAEALSRQFNEADTMLFDTPFAKSIANLMPKENVK